jgi:dienelactone hydrolase
MKPRNWPACAGLSLLATAGTVRGQTSPHFDFRRDTVLTDERVHITLVGVKPLSLVTIRLHAPNQQSEATFVSDAQGNVDLERAAPIVGSYTTIDGMGLFWSLNRNAASAPSQVRPAPPDQPLPFRLVAESDGATIATDTIWRRLMIAGVRVTTMRDSTMSGVLYEPPAAGPHPAMVVLSGSGGGTPGPATWPGGLASRGYVVLSLADHNDVGVPRQLSNIPLEYVEHALHWLGARASVDKTRIGVLGTSRGAELALLLGATYPELVHTVVAVVPSNVVWPGCCDSTSRLGPSWTLGGKPVPYLRPDSALESGMTERSRAAAIRQTPVHRARLANAGDVARAVIHVERSRAPILLISARDDGVWPSYEMAEQIMARLRRFRYAYPYEHHGYEGAGHFIARPYTTVMGLDDVPASAVGQRRSDSGGNPAMLARAREDAWKVILRFLDTNLRRTR